MRTYYQHLRMSFFNMVLNMIVENWIEIRENDDSKKNTGNFTTVVQTIDMK
jgi:hypothetical protein